VARTAVVTARTAVRFIVSSIALFNKTIQTFNPDETTNAYHWLGLSPNEVRFVESARREMNESVG
jgi:hypothetical protein